MASSFLVQFFLRNFLNSIITFFSPIFSQKFFEQHHTPYIRGHTGGIVRGVTGGGIHRGGYMGVYGLSGGVLLSLLSLVSTR